MLVVPHPPCQPSCLSLGPPEQAFYAEKRQREAAEHLRKEAEDRLEVISQEIIRRGGAEFLVAAGSSSPLHAPEDFDARTQW